MIECASKGAVFLYTKEWIVDGCASAGVGKVTGGFVAGAGAGVCQVVVMGPCTFLVTAVVTGGGQTSITSTISTFGSMVNLLPVKVVFWPWWNLSNC